MPGVRHGILMLYHYMVIQSTSLFQFSGLSPVGERGHVSECGGAYNAWAQLDQRKDG